jgi:hypothetical protein
MKDTEPIEETIEERVMTVALNIVPEIVHLQVQKEMELLEEKISKKRKILSYSSLFPTRITHVFLIDDTGMLIASGARQEGGIDADIIAGMFTAVQTFIEDSFTEESNKQHLERITKGDLTMLVEHMPPIYLLVIIKGKERPEIRMGMKRFLKRLFDEHGEVLRTWDGDATKVEEIQKKIENYAHYTYL